MPDYIRVGENGQLEFNFEAESLKYGRYFVHLIKKEIERAMKVHSTDYEEVSLEWMGATRAIDITKVSCYALIGKACYYFEIDLFNHPDKSSIKLFTNFMPIGMVDRFYNMNLERKQK